LVEVPVLTAVSVAVAALVVVDAAPADPTGTTSDPTRQTTTARRSRMVVDGRFVPRRGHVGASCSDRGNGMVSVISSRSDAGAR
jgi:hypothetical protein